MSVKTWNVKIGEFKFGVILNYVVKAKDIPEAIKKALIRDARVCKKTNTKKLKLSEITEVSLIEEGY